MIAVLAKSSEGITATFERHLKHPIPDVWAYLTDNELLAKWFPELRVGDLRRGGLITFDMQNGTFEETRITALEPGSLLEYTWGEDKVRFELSAEPDGCRLLLIETLGQITDHTPRDLAGWHVCLKVIEALLDGELVEDRKQIWEQLYEEYKLLVTPYRSS